MLSSKNWASPMVLASDGSMVLLYRSVACSEREEMASGKEGVGIGLVPGQSMATGCCWCCCVISLETSRDQ